MESSFIFNEKSASELDEQTQIATISSLQEHKIFLENINSEIRENFDEVQKKLNELIK